MKVKVPKRTNSRKPIRGAIAPAEDITLRGNHFTSHVKWYVGAPQGIEIAPASEFHDFRGSKLPASVTFSENFSIFKIRPHDGGCVSSYNFFASQRPAVILSENDIQAPADRTI